MAWHYADLTALTGAPPAPQVIEGAPFAMDGYPTSFNNQLHVNFVGNDYHVHELYYDGSWHHNDLTALTGAPTAENINIVGYEPPSTSSSMSSSSPVPTPTSTSSSTTAHGTTTTSRI